MMIKIETTGGDKAFIRIEHISSVIYFSPNESRLCMINGEYFDVKETPVEVLNMIKKTLGVSDA